MMVVLDLVVMFLRRLAIDGSHLTRLLIASAREFIADAEAVRLTQNPAALVSALRRIEGRSVIPGLAAGQDAMMIDGAHEGAFATHPTIAERVAAIISVTGSMALIAPAHRDTRPSELRAREKFGRRAGGLDAAFSRHARQSANAALARVSSGQRVQQARADARDDGGRRCRDWRFPMDAQRRSPQSGGTRRGPRPRSRADAVRAGRGTGAMPEARHRLG